MLQRLGFDSHSVNYNFTDEGFDIYNKRFLLRVLIDEQKNDEAEKMLEELSILPEFEKSIEKQFLLCSKAAIMINRNTDPVLIRQIVLEALSITMKKFSETEIKNLLLTNEDYQLINMLAVTYSREDNLPKAVEILLSAKENIEISRLSDGEKAKHQPLILYNLTKYLGLLERYEEAISICDCARDFCIKYNRMSLLPSIIFNKAYCSLMMGETSNCKRLFYQAYYSCDMMEQDILRELIKDYAKEKFGIVFDAE